MLEKRGVKLFLVFWIVMLLSLSAVSAFGFLDKFIGKGKVSLSPEESKSVEIRCESHSYKYKECVVADAEAIISVKVKKKLSDSKCKLGKSFGIKDNTNKIWVNNGCRADFTLTYLLKTPAKPSTPSTPTIAGSVAGTNAPYIQLLICRKD
jgi:hypothetical protein